LRIVPMLLIFLLKTNTRVVPLTFMVCKEPKVIHSCG
jgi:hypothetical protein